MDSVPPNGVPADLDAERALLGAVLIDDTAINDIVDLLPSDFYRTAHQYIFRAAQHLAADDKPIDLLTLRDELQQAGALEEVGGPAYIASLIDGMPRGSNIGYHAAIVKRHARARRLAGVAARVAAVLNRGEDLPAGDRRELDDALADDMTDRASPLIDDVTLINRPRVPELIDGRLPGVGQVWLVGAPGVGKTFVSLDLACCVATGLPWLGAPVVRRGPVVYVIGEGAGLLGKRVAGWKIGHHVMLDQKVLDLWDGPVQLLDTLATTRFIRSIAHLSPALVVIDTWQRCTAGADENSSRDNGIALANLDRIWKSLNCLVLVLHHLNAGGTRERGHTSPRGAADVMMLLTKADDELRLVNDKQKDDAEFGPLSIRLVSPYDGAQTLIPRLAADVLPSEALTLNQESILTALRESFGFTGATHADLLKACGVPERSYYRARNNLVKRGLVRLDGDIYHLASR